MACIETKWPTSHDRASQCSETLAKLQQILTPSTALHTPVEIDKKLVDTVKHCHRHLSATDKTEKRSIYDPACGRVGYSRCTDHTENMVLSSCLFARMKCSQKQHRRISRSCWEHELLQGSPVAYAQILEFPCFQHKARSTSRTASATMSSHLVCRSFHPFSETRLLLEETKEQQTTTLPGDWQVALHQEPPDWGGEESRPQGRFSFTARAGDTSHIDIASDIRSWFHMLITIY